MRLGIDIDNVISDFDRGVMAELLLEDKNKRNSGIINKDARGLTKGLLDWSKEEFDEFFNNNMERLSKTLRVRVNSKKVMDKLLDEGNEIYLISHRAFPHYVSPYETTVEWLKKHKINYTKLILSESADKTKECFENKIDIMFDDRISQCSKMIENGIKCYVMKTRFNVREKHGLPTVTSWQNLYQVVNQCKKEI